MNATRDANISSVNLDNTKKNNDSRRRPAPGYITNEGTGVKGDKQDEDDGHPDPDPESQA